jgi:hypothetical protein
MPNDVQTLFTQYWLAKLALQMRFPELSSASLDQIAKSFASVSAQPPTPPAPKPPAKEPKTKALPSSQPTRPPIREAITLVMGNDALPHTDVIDRLKARDWLPVSKNPVDYIRHVLNRHFARDPAGNFYVPTPDGQYLGLGRSRHNTPCEPSPSSSPATPAEPKANPLPPEAQPLPSSPLSKPSNPSAGPTRSASSPC